MKQSDEMRFLLAQLELFRFLPALAASYTDLQVSLLNIKPNRPEYRRKAVLKSSLHRNVKYVSSERDPEIPACHVCIIRDRVFSLG